MNDVNTFLPVLSLGLWVGVSMVFICKMLSYAIGFVIRLFRLS